MFPINAPECTSYYLPLFYANMYICLIAFLRTYTEYTTLSVIGPNAMLVLVHTLCSVRTLAPTHHFDSILYSPPFLLFSYCMVYTFVRLALPHCSTPLLQSCVISHSDWRVRPALFCWSNINSLCAILSL